MTTKAKQQREKGELISRRIALGAVCVALLNLGYTVWHDHHAGRSVDGRLGKLEATVRILTASVAPQLQHEVDETLQAAIHANNQDADRIGQRAQSSLIALRELAVPLSPTQASHIQRSALDLIDAHPDATSPWAVAATFVSLRSGSQEDEEQKDCFDEPPMHGAMPDEVQYSNCILDLGDSVRGAANVTHVTQRKDDGSIQATGSILPHYILRNVRIRYAGGPTLPFSRIDFVHCKFDFSAPPSVPTPQGQRVIRQLLASTSDDFAITS